MRTWLRCNGQLMRLATVWFFTVWFFIVMGCGGSSVEQIELYFKVDYPGIKDVEFKSAADTELKNSETVIGFVVNSQAYAIEQDALVKPENHIVNLVIDEIPISATFCDLSGCSRVFTRDEDGGLIDLRVGGVDMEDELVLLLDGKRYKQRSSRIPLEDYEFSVLTFGEWKAAHPETKVCEEDQFPIEDDPSA